MAVEYSPELATQVCDLMAGGMTMKAISQLDGMPARNTIWRWTERYPDFAHALTNARQAAADSYADDCIHIADTEPNAQKAKNQIDARKWLAGCIVPKRYGPRMDVNVTQTIDFRAAHVSAMKRVDVMRLGLPAPDLEAPGAAFVFAQPAPVDPFS